MTQQTINRGSAPDDETADTLYVTFGKVQSNFSELYTANVTFTTALAGKSDTSHTHSIYALVSSFPAGTTSQLLGATGTAGSAQAITLGTGLSLSGTTLNATGGSGSGTVGAGTTGTLAFYSANGTAVAPLTLGTNLSITGTTLNAAGGGGGGTLTGITTAAGSGLSGGGTSGTLTLTVNFGTTSGTVADGGAVATLLAAKAPLASPALTGTPTAPTAAGGTNTTQIATTAFVQSAVGTSYTLPTASTSVLGGVKPDGTTITINAGTGVITAVGGTATPGGASGTIQFNNAGSLGGYTKGNTLTVTTGTLDVTTSATNPVMDGAASPGTGSALALANHVHPTDTSRAPLASPTFTGTPAAPTATANDNSTKLATTAYADRPFTRTTPGAAPASGGTSGTTNFLREDGTWAAPASGGGSSSVPVTAANSGSSYALAFPASGSAAFDLTLTGNCAFTFSGGTAGQEQMIRVYARGGVGGFTPTFPTGVVWVGGVAPSAPVPSSGVAIYTFRTPDAGTTVFGEF